MKKKKPFKDHKIKVISIEEFIQGTEYFEKCKRHFYHGQVSDDCETLYKITPKYLIEIGFDWNWTCGLACDGVKIDNLKVAVRDGVTEYKVFDDEIERLNKELEIHKKSKKIPNQIKKLKTNRKLLHKYEDTIEVEPKDFNEYLVQTTCKTEIEEYKNKFAVFDVETNGFRKVNDDLLSVSIYDPTTGMCYNRFLPLELQPIVKTTFINGIEDDDLKYQTHWTQEEVDKIIDFFDLKNKTLLSFCGGQGKFDKDFIFNYCKRHNLKGFEELKYDNIKSYIPTVPFGCDGQLSKDNLCRIFNIEGVKEVHSGLNDCLLEWKLFEKLKSMKLFFINNLIYNYTKDYIVPVSYLNKYPILHKFADIDYKLIDYKNDLIYEYHLPKNVLKEVKKFPTNFTGMSLESRIRAMLGATYEDNMQFLTDNRRKLEYVGSLKTNEVPVPVYEKEDGSFYSILPENEEFIEEVNKASKIICESLMPTVEFIKHDIFKDSEIKDQELVISDNKVLALCDFSNEEAVLEMKTYKAISKDFVSDKLCRQLYYEAKGRKKYVLTVDFLIETNSRGKEIVKDIAVTIYRVKLKTSSGVGYHTLTEKEKTILIKILENPNITKSALKELYPFGVQQTIDILTDFGYIKKETDSPHSPWVVLRSPDDDKTKIDIRNYLRQ